MTNPFYERPIINSPYAYPGQHWELDADGQPTGVLASARRRSDLITPVRMAKKRKAPNTQTELDLVADDDGLSTADQRYNASPIRNELRGYVNAWWALLTPEQLQVTPMPGPTGRQP
ncbi:MAG: hypothetical protein IV093_15085 [Rubrivivax sp.]|nr:hypothetical protein [Rubrivivax sp.]